MSSKYQIPSKYLSPKMGPTTTPEVDVFRPNPRGCLVAHFNQIPVSHKRTEELLRAGNFNLADWLPEN